MTIYVFFLHTKFNVLFWKSLFSVIPTYLHESFSYTYLYESFSYTYLYESFWYKYHVHLIYLRINNTHVTKVTKKQCLLFEKISTDHSWGPFPSPKTRIRIGKHTSVSRNKTTTIIHQVTSYSWHKVVNTFWLKLSIKIGNNTKTRKYTLKQNCIISIYLYETITKFYTTCLAHQIF